MKTTLQFSDDEQPNALLAAQATDYWCEIHELHQRLRSHIKYGEQLTLEEVYDELSEIQSRYELP